MTQTVVCGSCYAVLDAKDPNLQVLQKMERRMTHKVLIPLGKRGKIKGDPFEVIGFQVRSITVEQVDYFWREYVLWSPYKGFRYLTEYDGHWNDVVIAKSTPEEKGTATQPTIAYIGQTFRHFQTATATTRFILGEFPWQVRVGDTAVVRDFVAPPYMLSQETTPDESTWSVGTYMAPARVWENFELEGTPPTPRGVYANQPNPNAGAWKSVAGVFALLAALLLVLLVVRVVTAQRRVVFTERYTFGPGNAADGADSGAFVTPIFTLGGRTSNVELAIGTDLSNNWIYYNLALINDETGVAYDFGREVSYYSGRDSDGAWSEGSRRDVSYLPSVPSGRYYLRVQPEGNPLFHGTVGYTLRVRRDVPRPSYYLITLLVLALPPVLAGARSWGFESARWKESDHAPSSDD